MVRFPKDGTSLITVILFAAAYGVVWASGRTSLKQLIGDLIALYLITWGLYMFLSDLPRLELRKRFILMTGMLIVLMALFEGPAALGLLDYREILPVRTTDLWAKPGYDLDQELIWIRKPFSQQKGTLTRGNIGGAICSEATSDQEFDVKYDRHGFRNHDDLQAADIAVIGDSYVEAPMIQYADLLTSRLGALQNRTVANLGQLGYGPQQELTVLKRYAVNLRPKTIVWVFYEGNDLTGARAYPERASMIAARGWLDDFWDRSFSKNVLSGLQIPLRCVPHAEILQQYGYVRDQHGERRRMYFVSQELAPIDAVALMETRNILEAAYELSKRNGIDFVVAFAPSKYRVYDGIADFTEATEGFKSWKLNDLPDQMKTVVTSISPKIGYLDLTPALRRESAKGVMTYLLEDTHWTAEGHRVVAEAIHELLVGRSQKWAAANMPSPIKLTCPSC
jgi:hypothetical protein